MKYAAIIIAIVVFPVVSFCQTFEKAAGQAFLVTRMAAKFHVAPREVNKAFSADVFKGMLQRADEDKLFFTQSDIALLSAYTATLDDEIKLRKTGYLRLFAGIYQQRLKQADSLTSIIAKKPFDFNATEKFTAAEQDTWSQPGAGQQQKLYKKLKADVLDDITSDLPEGFASSAAAKQKKYTDSAETAAYATEVQTFERRINDLLQSQGGVAALVGNLYCETIAACYDPHTEFFPPEEKENFETALGKTPFRFGFKIMEDKDGGVLIDNLEPGSPAFKGGKMKKGDKFVSVQYDGKPMVDVSKMSVDEFSSLLDQNDHHALVTFTMKKADGSVTRVPLQKEQVSDSDEERVKSFILKGAGTVGYIYLPAFYEDWNTKNNGLNGCANDVGREILKLKKENITGLIIDLRYNGGGSSEEATELAGIFIDAGPVAQMKEKNGKVFTMKDVDRGTIYDGPLVIMVNGYSASASELVAGTLQDYNRAVIVGSPTYGKATAQVVLPMDTTVSPETFTGRETENYLKVTIGKLYRVSGATAQFMGVQPDVVLPDLLDASISKEADQAFALRPDVIAANKYYSPYAPLPVKALAATVQPEIDTSKYFTAVKNLIAAAKKQTAVKDITLNLKERLAENTASEVTGKSVSPASPSRKFSIQNNQFELARLQADGYLKETNDEFSKQVSLDPYIGIAYDVACKLKVP